jgi:hypothetical protein
MSLALKEPSGAKYRITPFTSTSYLTEAEAASILNDRVELEKFR